MAERTKAQSSALELRTAYDLLLKLNREIDRLENANDAPDVIDHASNAAMTAWHITDWVWHDLDKDRTAEPFRLIAKIASKPVRSLGDMQDFALAQSKEIEYCENIAVSTKHFGSDGTFLSEVQQRKEYTQDPRKASGIEITVNEFGSETRSVRNIAELVLLDDERRLPVLPLLKTARDWWTDILTKSNLSKSIPAAASSAPAG